MGRTPAGSSRPTQTARPYYSPIKPKSRHQGCGVLLAKGLVLLVENGAPGKTRTSNPQIRSLVLYPIELRARAASGVTPLRGRGPYTNPCFAASLKMRPGQKRKTLWTLPLPMYQLSKCALVAAWSFA